MFLLGMMLSYFLIFPLTFRFLGTYQVSDVVENTVTIESYIDTLLMISLSMGLVFEIPVVCWIMGRMGIINAKMMCHYRRHVIVALLVMGAVITPTADVFTLLLVSMPMWLLYEFSIHIVRRIRY
jgi:sec-independent protein translocase protein TatC